MRIAEIILTLMALLITVIAGGLIGYALRLSEAKVVTAWNTVYQPTGIAQSALDAALLRTDKALALAERLQADNQKLLALLAAKPAVVPPPLRDWDSPAQLRAFLAVDDTDKVIYLRAGGDGTVQFNGQCEDAAFQLRARAAEIGRRLETQDLYPAEIWQFYQKRVSDTDRHMIAKAFIGNEIWYIEPSDDRAWLGNFLD